MNLMNFEKTSIDGAGVKSLLGAMEIIFVYETSNFLPP